jgi:long-chain acyl-CoA synthetase
VDYISTAYVAGKRKGVVYEEELEHRKGFHNTYEQSKYETELDIRQAMQELPICVMRPSIIIGNSKTGETTNFKAFYWPIRVYAMGQMKILPGSRNCPVDLVPVDYVASAIVHLSAQSKALGKTYHLTAGRDNLITIGEALDAAVEFFKIKAPLTVNPRFMALTDTKLSHFFLSEHTHKTLQLGKPYYPYFNLKLEFDNSAAAEVLNEVNISAQPVRRFFDTLFRYCVETNWGHKQAKVEETEPLETETPGTGAVAFGR